MDKLVSVIIPIYGVEKELPRCLDSLLAQTYSNFELLLIDDGSKDGSYRVMEEYARRDGRIRLFQKENGGVSSARNMGLDQAKGDYICFVDPDDWVAPCYLEWLYRAIEQSGSRMSSCRLKHVEQMDAVVELPKSMPELRMMDVGRCSVWEQDACLQCCRMMAERDLIQDIRFEQEVAIGEDSLFTMQLMLKEGRIACVPCVLYFYWMRPDSALHQAFTAKQYTESEAWERIYALVQNRGKILERTSEEKLALTYAHVYYRMAHSTYADEAGQKELIRKIRKHWRAVLRVPNRLMREKGKMLMMVICPQLGQVMWRIGKKMKQVSP